jgi:hypothetical protein
MKTTITLIVAVVVLGCAGIGWAENYTWVGAANSSWVDPANWSPAGFANTVSDVCTVGAGGQPKILVSGQTFTSQLNIASAALLHLGSYCGSTVSNLHLQGGWLKAAGDSISVNGKITVDNDSAIVATQRGYYGLNFGAVFYGSGNLVFTNNQDSTTVMTAANTNYTGKWILSNLGPGALSFYDYNNPWPVGSGGLVLTRLATNIAVRCSTLCPWELDLRGLTVRCDQDYNDRVHSGPFTLLSDATIRAQARRVTLTGKISGSGALRLRADTTSYPVVVTNAANDYTGGTEVLMNTGRASAPNALGSGHVCVRGGTTLDATVSGVMSNAASLYLDYNGSAYGKLNMTAASITTTVAHAYIGGTGGWVAAVGYTELSPGLYASNSVGMLNYLTGSGKLKVDPPVVAGLPAVANIGVSDVTATSATLTGLLVTNGGASATVSLYWGETNGGTNAWAWANTNSFAAGQWDSGTFPTTNLTSLVGDRNYYFTFGAVGDGGNVLATPSRNFITGELTLEATDALCGANGADTATVLISRPANCTNETLTVYYTLSGDAIPDTDYTASPPSGTAQILAGQSSATITLTPNFPPFNYGAPKSIVLTLMPGAYAIGTTSNANCSLANLSSSAYTWSGPANGNWLSAANWAPAGFVNAPSNTCTVEAGGQAKALVNGDTFYAQLNINTGAVLFLGDYISPITVSNLHLCGGMLLLGAAQNVGGRIAVDAASTLVSGGEYGNGFAAVISGSGDLALTNRMNSFGSYSQLTSANPNFSGRWILNSTGQCSWEFTKYNGCNVGSGGLVFTPRGTNFIISADTSCPWELDLRGASVRVDYAYGNNAHGGAITLLSDVIFQTSFGRTTFSGQVTGPGGLKLYSAATSGGQMVVLTNTLNNYAGGTEVITNIAQAATANALGTGHVRVNPGATLEAVASAVMSRNSWLYLDASGSVYGKLAMPAADTLTTCARAFIGGFGGWQSPVGYTELAPGFYNSSSPGMANYLTGSGTLRVLSGAGTILLIQ